MNPRHQRLTGLTLAASLLAAALASCGTIEATSPGDEAMAQWQAEMSAATTASPTADAPAPSPKPATTTTTEAPTPQPTVTVTATATATVTATPTPAASRHGASSRLTATQDVNLRTGPGDAYAVSGKLRAGQEVTALESQSGWVKVTARGWTYEGFLAR
ncbi:SH3 domain-containing protein (plasmid) [Citricoccus nitrophenolicus]